MKNLYFLIYFFLFTRIVYGQSNEFVTEFHDLNDNQIPNGWVFDTNGSPGGDISNGRINSYIVDGGAHLSKTASVSNITQEIILEMDTYVTYSYWGMVPNFQIYNGDKILSFRSGVERYDHPDNTIVYTLTYYDGITTTYEFDNSAPRVDGIYHLKLIMNDNGYRFIGTDPSDVEAFNIFVEDTNYFDFRQIDKISYSLSTHTDNDSWIDNLSITVNESTPSCVNTVYPVTLGGGEPGGVAVQSVTLSPSNPAPNETVQAEITWVFSGNTNIVKGNVYGDWDTASELGQIYNGIDGSQTVTQTVSFTAPGTAGSHSLRFIWAYDIGDFADYDSGNLPTESQCSTWGNSKSIVYDHAFNVETACVNTVYPVTLDGGEPGGVAVQSVTLTPSNPGPNETVQAEITWVFSGDGNIVKANVYGDWDTASELGQTFNSIDNNQTVTQTVSFTAPGTAGSYNLRFIWAYDIGDFADYDSGNLPTESQCSTWGNSKSVVYDHAFNVETACVNTVYPVTLGGGEPGGVAVQSVTLTPSNPGPNETVQAEITWAFSGNTNIVKGNVYGDWDTASELGQIYNGIDGNQTLTQTVSFTTPGTAGSYNLRFIWAYDIGDFADYDSGNLPTESQCSTWGNSKSVVYDHAFNVETATTNVDYLIVEDGNAFIGNTNNINVILTNTEIIKGFQFDITFPDGFVFDPADITNIGLPENYQISSADIGSNSFRVVGFSLTNETIAAGSTSIISFPTYINDGTATGDYPIPITNVTLSDINNVDVSTPSPGDGIITVYSHPMGDANGDDAIDILDILNVIDYIFGNPPANFNIDLADVNGDGTINVLDILEIQDIILSPSTSANLSNGKSSSEKQQLSGNNYLIITDDTFSTSTSETMEINLSNDDVIKGLQFDFTLPSGFTLNSADIPGAATSRLDGFTISAQEVSQNTFRVIIFSLTSATVSPGNTPIFNLPEFIESSVSNGVYPISFTNVTLSDTNNSDISTVAPSTGQITVGTLGLIDFENNRNTFILYPNPTKEVINIKGNLSKLETVDFYSITGEHVMQIHDNFGKINIESLQSGLYFIKLTGEMTTEFKKIIKN